MLAVARGQYALQHFHEITVATRPNIGIALIAVQISPEGFGQGLKTQV
jgi:hypothetical protein